VFVHYFADTVNSIRIIPPGAVSRSSLAVYEVGVYELDSAEVIPEDVFAANVTVDSVFLYLYNRYALRLKYHPFPVPADWLMVRASRSWTLGTTEEIGFGFVYPNEGGVPVYPFNRRDLCFHFPVDSEAGFWFQCWEGTCDPFASGDLAVFSFEPSVPAPVHIRHVPQCRRAVVANGTAPALLFDIRGRLLRNPTGGVLTVSNTGKVTLRVRPRR
jgi:hypothetical protein